MAEPRASGGFAVPPSTYRVQSGQPFTIALEHLEFETQRGPWFLDITDDVRRVIRESGVDWGQVTVFSNHTTAAIHLQENEPLLIEDMKEFLERMAPRDCYYRHNDFGIRTVNMHEHEPKNGHSHCQHILLSTSETIPLVNGTLQLGEWQSIFLVELCESRRRRVSVSILGMPGGE